MCCDLSQDAAQATAAELTEIYGVGIGVAGSGISGCGPTIGLGVDITDRNSIQAMIHETLLAYGGIDRIIVTAGVFVAPERDGSLSDDKWKFTFDVNVRGSYNVVDELRGLLKEQGLSASVVLTTSVNGVVGKKGSIANATSKAAANLEINNRCPYLHEPEANQERGSARALSAAKKESRKRNKSSNASIEDGQAIIIGHRIEGNRM